ncbi:MAG TPA: methylmalonyl-CoA epimerase [Dehalococcoidia bacterium]|nr:methylmalonyl-CoA epimerase [Dehalococcoidia bacterium]
MIRKIHHVGIVVEDLERAYGFYRDVLGLCVAKEDTVPDQGVRAALMPVGHSEIELLQPITEGTGIQKFLASRGEGMHHLCFETDGIDRELDELKAKGAPLIDERPRPGLAGMIAFLHPKCTHRTLVELAEPPESHEGGHKVHGELRAKELDHVALAVPDLDAAVADYGTLFGLQSGGTLESAEMGLRAVMLPVGSSFVELLTATTPDSPLAQRIATIGGGGMLTLALEVENLDDAISWLRSKACAVSDASPGPIPNTRIARAEPSSTHGVPLQLIQR